jgi:D-arabinose 5-phosphate isomerase GutQ
MTHRLPGLVVVTEEAGSNLANASPLFLFIRHESRRKKRRTTWQASAKSQREPLG